MQQRVTALLAAVIMLCLIPAAVFAISPYSQDFEGLVQSDTAALGNDGWQVFGNVFGPDWSYWYGYGPFPAPNDGAAFCAIASGEGGSGQGAQQLSVYSDYNNTDHGNGAHIESLVFQEQTIEAGDVSEMWVFEFEAKLGNLTGQSTGLAFIKTLDPNNGYATTNYITMDMTGTPSTWTYYTLNIVIDPSLQGQLIQFGFENMATNYEPSGIFYDNILFHPTGPVATDSKSFGEMKAQFK